MTPYVLLINPKISNLYWILEPIIYIFPLLGNARVLNDALSILIYTFKQLDWSHVIQAVLACSLKSVGGLSNKLPYDQSTYGNIQRWAQNGAHSQLAFRKSKMMIRWIYDTALLVWQIFLFKLSAKCIQCNNPSHTENTENSSIHEHLYTT